MLNIVRREGVLTHSDALEYVCRVSGERIVYLNELGHQVISRKVLDVFKAKYAQAVKWSARNESWSLCEKNDLDLNALEASDQLLLDSINNDDLLESTPDTQLLLNEVKRNYETL